MLTIKFEGNEYYDEGKQSFLYTDPKVLNFEYTLKAIFDWEGLFRTSWLKLINAKQIKTEHLVVMMSLCCKEELDVSEINQDMLLKFVNYINDSPTATKIQNDNKSAGRSSYISAEEIYSIMVFNKIPLELENWNYHRLMSLIAIINETKSPPKKRSMNEIYAEQNRINDERLKKMGG